MSRFDPAKALIDIERERGRRSLHYFISKAWPVIDPAVVFEDNWHVGAIAEHLQAVTEGQIRNLLINVPPGSGKSTIVSVCWNAHTWITHPDASFLYTSFDRLLTTRDARKVQTLVTSQWFRERWGDLYALDPNEGVGEFNVYGADGQPTGGWRFSTSIDGKTTGRHPWIRVVDDPSKPKNATPLALEEVIKWWQTTFNSRGDHRTRRTAIIMQRIAENDLSGHVLEHETGWEHLRIPLEFDRKPFVTSLGCDPRTEEGDSFWRARFTPKVIEEIKTNNDPQIVSAQYGQDPMPPGGTIFKADTFKEWTLCAANDGEGVSTYQERVRASLPPGGIYLQSWDFSFKDTDGSDWCVGTCWYWIDAQYYLVDLIRRKLEFVDALDAVRAFRAKWPEVRHILVEDKANGPAIISTLKRTLPGLEPYNPGADSKVTRAMSVQGLFRAGNVHFPSTANDTGAEWMHDYTTELLGFPRKAHDDQVDSTTQALAYMSANFTPTPDYGEALKALEREMRAA